MCASYNWIRWEKIMSVQWTKQWVACTQLSIQFSQWNWAHIRRKKTLKHSIFEPIKNLARKEKTIMQTLEISNSIKAIQCLHLTYTKKSQYRLTWANEREKFKKNKQQCFWLRLFPKRFLMNDQTYQISINKVSSFCCLMCRSAFKYASS